MKINAAMSTYGTLVFHSTVGFSVKHFLLKIPSRVPYCDKMYHLICCEIVEFEIL